MVWIHIVACLLMLMLDIAWWVIALRLAKGTSWRILISLSLAVPTIAVANELAGRLGLNGLDLSFLPTAVQVAVVLWHYFSLTILCAVGFIWLCIWFIRRKPVKPAESKPETPMANAVTRRQFLSACTALAPPLFTFGLTGIAMSQLSDFRVRRYTLQIPSLPRDLDGLTIANVSDIHVGEWTHGKILRRIVETTNSLRPDLVVLTGDLINYELSDLPGALSLVKQMPGRYGTWMIEGNHDMYEDGAEFDRQVKASGVPLLLDETDVVQVRGCPVQLLGTRWMDGVGGHLDRVITMQLRILMEQRQPDAFPIFLAHHPHAFDAAVKAGLPLTLSGHTHGGQLMLDKDIGVGPILFRYWSGLYQRGNSQLIVSTGVGNTFPLRINAPAEIVHITLRCA